MFMRTLVLCSNSPRRKQLLENAGFEFHVLTSQLSEILDKNLTIDDALMELARSKAKAVLDNPKILELKDILLLSADTEVILDGIIFGKPSTRGQAIDFLRRLSSRTHDVKTAVCCWDLNSKKIISEVETSKVTFRELTKVEISEYVATGDPMDKAGGYGIQGTAKNFITSVDGAWDNVMGLPVERVNRILKQNGWQISRKKP